MANAHFFFLHHLVIGGQNIFPSSDSTCANSALSLGLRLDKIYRALKQCDFWKASSYWGPFEALISDIQCFK